MKVLGIAGWSGSGKTTLLTALVPLFKARGLRVSTIKHAHHRLVLDQPGKDSDLHARAGAEEVILATAGGFALFSRQEAPELRALLPRLAPVDVVLVEGFKADDIPKLEVYRPALGKPPLWPDMPMLAVATDARLEGCVLPVLPLGAPGVVADFLFRALGLQQVTGTKE